MKAEEIIERLKLWRNKTEIVDIDSEDWAGRHRSLEREQYVLDEQYRDLLKEAEHKIKSLSKKNKELEKRVAELEEYKDSHCLDDEYSDGFTM